MMIRELKTPREAANMKDIKGFTVLYKVSSSLVSDGRFSDPTVYSFTCGASDVEDAVRQFKVSKLFRVDGKFHSRSVSIVRVFKGDGVGHCDCKYCQSNPSMSRKVRVIPTKMPKWMGLSFGKTAGRRSK